LRQVYNLAEGSLRFRQIFHVDLNKISSENCLCRFEQSESRQIYADLLEIS
jgi:hypothetical protein